MSYYPAFAQLVTIYLQTRDRSPTWLARQLGVNPGTVNRWLNQEARPSSPEMVIRIADLLGAHRPAERQALLIAADYGYQDVRQAESSGVRPKKVASLGRSERLEKKVPTIAK